jgi:hypothetical protein
MWQEDDRRIFAFEFRGQTQFADPVRIHRLLLQATAGQLNAVCERANRVIPDHDNPAEPGTMDYVAAYEARGTLAKAALSAFALEPFDPTTGTGTLESEAMAILYAYLQWESQKKTTGGTTI